MTKNFINKELTKKHRFFIIQIMITSLSWGVLLLNSELLVVPIGITFAVLFLVSKKIPEYTFWCKIKEYYNENELEEFIDSEYETVKNTLNYSKSNPKNQTITGTISFVQYQTQKDIYKSSKKFNKVSHLLKLKKLIEKDNKLLNGNQDDIF